MDQPATSPGEVASQLEQLLGRLTAPWTLARSAQLEAAYKELDAGFRRLAPLAAAQERQRQRLCRALVQAADCLSRLPEKIKGLDRLEPLAVFAYLNVAFMLVALCTEFGPAAGLLPAEQQRLCGCARLVLTSGTNAVLKWTAQLRQGQACGPILKGILHSGLLALGQCLQLAASAGWLPWFAAHTASPALLASWLGATVAALDLLSQQRTRQAPSFLDYTILTAVWTMIHRLAFHPEFAVHLAALEGRSELGPALFRLLLANIPALAVGLQLPPERQPDGCTWAAAASAAAAFVCNAVQQGGGRQLFTADNRSGEAIRQIEKLQRSAALLMQHVPLPEIGSLGSPEAAKQLESCCGFVTLLACVAAGGMMRQPFVLPTAQLLALLPRLRATLQLTLQHLAAGGPLHGQYVSCLDAGIGATWTALQAQLRSQLTVGQRVALTPAELERWCSCAAEMLRLLPVAAVAQAAAAASINLPATSQPNPAAAADPAVTPPGTLADQAVGVAAAVARHAAQHWSPAQGGGTLQGSSLATAKSAVQQLNTAGCRLVHFASSQAAAQLQGERLLVRAVPIVADSLLAASQLLESDWLTDEEDSRLLQSMCLASWEVILVAHEQQALPLYPILPVLALLAALCPLLVLKAEFQRLWVAMIEPFLDRADQDVLRSACGVLASTGGSDPLLAVHMLLSVSVQQHLERRLGGWGPVVSQLKEAAASEAAAVADCDLAEPNQQLVASIQQGLGDVEQAEAGQQDVLSPARRLAAVLMEWWGQPEQAAKFQLQVAQAAAARSCAYLRCANLGSVGGPAAGQGEGSQRCSACRAVWYCGTACSHADWRSGHRRVCRALGAARAADKAARRQAADAENQAA